MPLPTLADLLEQEHREIDGSLGAYLADSATAPQLREAIGALRRHIYIEEEFVFPKLRAAGLFAAVLVMLREHGEIWRLLDQLDAALTGDPDGPDAAECCEKLLGHLDAHNAKEEPIIYSQTDAAVTGDDAAKVRELLASGTTPPGWVCAQA